MEKKIQFCGITYILVILSLGKAGWTTAKPLSLAPTPATTDCSQLIFDMLDCMTFLNNGPSDPKPSPSCCTGFETVLDTDAGCVCEGLKNAASMGISVNITKAATLPSLCHVSAPPCDISIAPTPSPSIPSPATPSPSIPSPATPSPSIPSPGTSPAIPPKTSPPTASPPTNNPPTNPPANSPPPTSPITPPPAIVAPPTSTPSAPTTSPPSGASPKANSPAAATVAPSSLSSRTSIGIMPVFIASSIIVVGSFSFLA